MCTWLIARSISTAIRSKLERRAVTPYVPSIRISGSRRPGCSLREQARSLLPGQLRTRRRRHLDKVYNICIQGSIPNPTQAGVWWRDDDVWRIYSPPQQAQIHLGNPGKTRAPWTLVASCQTRTQRVRTTSWTCGKCNRETLHRHRHGQAGAPGRLHTFVTEEQRCLVAGLFVHLMTSYSVSCLCCCCEDVE